MDFVFCTDKNYLKGYDVLMLSILRFAPPSAVETLRFHVLGDDLDDADKRLLEGIAARRENTEVAFYEPARVLSAETAEQIDETLQNTPSHGYLAKSAYYRILAADLLPQDVRRALYLDGDIVCTGSLADLFATDLKGCPVGMCLDTATSSIYSYNRLGYPPHEGYFNSGVILFDLDAWRRENLTQCMLDYLSLNAKKLLVLDQDLINACLHGRVAHLDFSFNVRTSYFNVFYWIKEEENNYYAHDKQFLPKSGWPALLAACKAPRLVHFAWVTKPWHRECDNPFTPVWRYFCSQSPWANEPLQWRNPHLKAKIKRLGRKALERLKLIAPKGAIPYPEEAYRIAQGILDSLLEEADA